MYPEIQEHFRRKFKIERDYWLRQDEESAEQLLSDEFDKYLVNNLNYVGIDLIDFLVEIWIEWHESEIDKA